MEETVKFAGGVTSSVIPRFELVPRSALISLAKRFEEGIARKGAGAWNALTLDKSAALDSDDFVINRLAHCIDHCYKAIEKITSGVDDGDDDAGAILFGGAVLAEYKKRRAGNK